MRPPITHLLLIFFLLSLTTAHSWSSDSLPNPQKDTANVCGRSKPSAICDPDGYLSESDADTIDGLINFIQAGTHGFHKVACPSRGNSPVGAQLAVAIFDAMPFGFGDKEKRAYQFAKDLHDRWGVGDADCQNGVVIVFAVKDRAMGFSIGKGVNGIFKDSMLPAVMADMRPMLKGQAYGKAIIEGVTDVGNILSGGEPPAGDSSDWLGMAAILAVGGGVAAISSAAARRKRNQYQRCKDRLKKIDRDRGRASDNNYVITSCPICLEDFKGEEGEGEQRQGTNMSGATVTATAPATSGGISTDDMHTEREQVRLVTNENGGQQSTTIRIAGDGGASTNTTDGEGEDRIQTLSCGHKFHESCILSWFSGGQRTNTQCPICRQPIDGSEPVEQRTNNGAPGGWDVYDPEYSFRMRRMHYYYPDYVTWSMINDWHGNRYSHNRPMATSAAFTRVDPVVVAAAARASGGGGSSFSFGGGSSAGGGGGGGGW